MIVEFQQTTATVRQIWTKAQAELTVVGIARTLEVNIAVNSWDRVAEVGIVCITQQ